MGVAATANGDIDFFIIDSYRRSYNSHVTSIFLGLGSGINLVRSMNGY